MEAHDEVRAVGCVGVDLDGVEVAAFPKLRPGERVARDELIERAGAGKRRPRLRDAVGARAIARRVERHELLHVHPLASGKVHHQLLAHAGGLPHEAPLDRAVAVAGSDADPCGERDAQLGLRRLRLEQHGLGIRYRRAIHQRVRSLERAVALDAGVGDPTIEQRTDGEPARPVAGDDGHVLAGEMPIAHVNEPTLDE